MVSQTDYEQVTRVYFRFFSDRIIKQPSLFLVANCDSEYRALGELYVANIVIQTFAN